VTAVPAAGDAAAAWPSAVEAVAESVIGLLIARDQTIGTAESLTGGLVAATLTTVPGASAVVRGGIVAYAADLKTSLLGVPADLIDRVGTVHADVAVALAKGARAALGASIGVGTTGAAGPDPADGQPAGTVHIAVAMPERIVHEALALDGGRAAIRLGTVGCVLRLLEGMLMEEMG
jgi:nicotinamide-nucleotide amidase